MSKQDEISPRYGTTLWVEIRKLYESKQQHDYARIKALLTAEFDLEKFPSRRTFDRHARDEGWKRHIPQDNLGKVDKKYTEEFWICVRAIYEDNPKITYKRLKEKVQNELQCIDFPSPDMINARAKAGDWKRLNELVSYDDHELRKVAKSAKNLTKNNGVKITFNGKNVEQYQGDVDEIDPSELLDFDAFNEIAENTKSTIKNLLMTTAVRQRKMSEVISKNRKRIGSIGEIGDMLSDKLIMNHALLMSPEVRMLNHAVQHLTEENKILMKTIGMFNEITYGRRESMKLELQMYGVSIDDLRIVDSNARMKDLEDDSAYEAQKQRLIEERKMIAERNLYISSGGLERDTQAEAKRRMDEAGLSDDDGDYDDISD